MSQAGYEEIFRSGDLAIRRVDGFDTPYCVVTFDSFTDDPSLDRVAFGEEFFRSRKVDSIHVLSRENDWYQYPEMQEAMACVVAATRHYRRVVTYGSSMGAYAAIRLAGLVGAQCAIALSPQFSIDLTVAPYENRWLEYSWRFQPVWERSLPFPVIDEAYLVYDPHDMDRHHAAAFKAVFDFTPVPLPYAGHPVSGFLSEVGLLPSAVLAMCDGTFDASALIDEAWRLRERSAQYFLARAVKAPRMNQRLALLEQSLAVAPNYPSTVARMAIELDKAGRYTESLAYHAKVLAVYPDHPGRLQLYSFTLQRSGDWAGALAVMDKISLLTNGAMPYEARRARLRKRFASRERYRRPARTVLRWLRDRWQAVRPALRP